MAQIDPMTLGAWFDAYSARLVLYARQWLAPGEAEDAVQDAFVGLMGQRQPPENVKAWLFTAVRNASVSSLRSHLRRRRRERARAAERVEWFESRPDELIDARAAQEALEAMPDDQREVVTLRIWGQMTLREISDIADTSPATALRRYRQGLAALRAYLEASCRTHPTPNRTERD
ncbi:MAG: sigma-70 family RNA polymerase sigma factor [Planctomycetes bacterium]|nr:sigma-70 family RNA polymerase sigma factor [Planctomycetota bacterium]